MFNNVILAIPFAKDFGTMHYAEDTAENMHTTLKLGLILLTGYTSVLIFRPELRSVPRMSLGHSISRAIRSAEVTAQK